MCKLCEIKQPFVIDEIENAELMDDITDEFNEEEEEHLKMKRKMFQNN